MSIIKVRNVFKEYKKNDVLTKVLKGVNLSIDEGEFVAINGESGSGKTTFLKIVSGLIPFCDGKIEIFGRDIKTFSNSETAMFRKKMIGFVFQNNNLIENLTCYENIIFPLILNNEKTDKISILEIMQKFNLEKVADKFPNEVSGGEAQRTAILRAIITKPKILFADEPTGSLDAENGKKVMEMLKDLNQNEKTTIILITHSLESAKYADRIIKFKDGRIVNE